MRAYVSHSASITPQTSSPSDERVTKTFSVSRVKGLSRMYHPSTRLRFTFVPSTKPLVKQSTTNHLASRLPTSSMRTLLARGVADRTASAALFTALVAFLRMFLSASVCGVAVRSFVRSFVRSPRDAMPRGSRLRRTTLTPRPWTTGPRIVRKRRPYHTSEERKKDRKRRDDLSTSSLVCPTHTPHRHFEHVTMYTHPLLCTSSRPRRPSRPATRDAHLVRLANGTDARARFAPLSPIDHGRAAARTDPDV